MQYILRWEHFKYMYSFHQQKYYFLKKYLHIHETGPQIYLILIKNS